MTKTITILLALIIGSLIYLFYSRESGHKRIIRELEQRHKQSLDSAAHVTEYYQKQAKEYLIHFTQSTRKALQVEEKLDYALEENRILRRKVKRHSVDSVRQFIGTRYGQH